MKDADMVKFEQVDGASLFDGFDDDRDLRWVEKTEGFLWGLCSVVLVAAVVLVIVRAVVLAIIRVVL